MSDKNREDYDVKAARQESSKSTPEGSSFWNSVADDVSSGKAVDLMDAWVKRHR